MLDCFQFFDKLANEHVSLSDSIIFMVGRTFLNRNVAVRLFSSAEKLSNEQSASL
jgi:hypothetical protein